eukprot:augustus_masked-scaffold_5-processed-gene-20.30-mRNA-1 protein AED:1.00 eAED:1.00 QI:0/0/0/0/1/1/2/0/402
MMKSFPKLKKDTFNPVRTGRQALSVLSFRAKPKEAAALKGKVLPPPMAPPSSDDPNDKVLLQMQKYLVDFYTEVNPGKLERDRLSMACQLWWDEGVEALNEILYEHYNEGIELKPEDVDLAREKPDRVKITVVPKDGVPDSAILKGHIAVQYFLRMNGKDFFSFYRLKMNKESNDLLKKMGVDLNAPVQGEKVDERMVEQLMKQAWEATATEREAKKKEEKQREQVAELESLKKKCKKLSIMENPFEASNLGKECLKGFISLIKDEYPYTNLESDIRELVKSVRLLATKHQNRSLFFSSAELNSLYGTLVVRGFDAKEKGRQLLEVAEKFKTSDSAKLKFAVYLYSFETIYCLMSYLENKEGKDEEVVGEVRKAIALSKEFDPEKPIPPTQTLPKEEGESEE